MSFEVTEKVKTLADQLTAFMDEHVYPNEVLARYGTAEQQERWLRPLLDGKNRSAFGMTEPDVASSDATNIALSIVRDGDHYVINGRKWWTSGVPDPRCQILIVMGQTARWGWRFGRLSAGGGLGGRADAAAGRWA